MELKLILFLMLNVVGTLFYLLGLVFFITDREPGDKCDMTYMFEYPQYVRISQNIDKSYPKYGLYAYGEGRTTKKARNMYFNGIPVLFIPGNAGSYQQVRSLASIALRKAINSGSSFHFDYFTVDLHSEFSAFYGPTLYDQLEYVLYSVEQVLKLYKTEQKQLILIGHSVGGIIAKKAIARLQKLDKNLIPILITLASPLINLPIYFDKSSSDFYTNSIIKPNNVVAISIAGGYSDLLVPAYLTRNLQNNSINVVSTNIAKSWVEANHVQILWCKQIVLAINRALFDIVDRTTYKIKKNTNTIEKVFQHHLIHNSGSNTQKGIIKFDYRGEWLENIQKQYTINLPKGLKKANWYMIGITMLNTYEMVTILAINLEVIDWIFACNAAYPNKASRVCIEGEHLTHLSEIAPTSRFKRRLVTLNLHEIYKTNKEFTHVVIKTLPTSEPVTLHVDTYGAAEREAEISLSILSFKKITIVPEKAVIYNLIFPDLKDPLQVYKLYVEAMQCENKQYHVSATLFVPWANESVHSYFTESMNKPFLLRIQHSKPANNADDQPKVRLILNPSCSYKISINFDLLGTFGQLARYYSIFLISTFGVVFLLTFQSQINVMAKYHYVPIFFNSIINGCKEIWIIFVAALLAIALSNYYLQLVPEFQISSNHIYVGFAMMVLIMVSYVLLFLLVAAYSFALFTLESTIYKLMLKFFARTITLNVKFSDYLMSFLQKMPFLVVAALLILSFAACGSLALCVGAIFYFLKLTQMSQEYIEQIAWFLVKSLIKKFKKRKESFSSESEKSELTEIKKTDEQKSDTKEIPKPESFTDLTEMKNKIFFHSSIFFLWIFVAVLNIPSVLTWAHNFSYNLNLSPDESFITGIIFSIGALFLWQFNLPRMNRKFLLPLRLITISLIPITFLYASISIYRLNYMLTFLFVLVILQQFAPKIDKNIENNFNNELREKYDEIKTKID